MVPGCSFQIVVSGYRVVNLFDDAPRHSIGGGSWHDADYICEVSIVGRLKSEIRISSYGFRIARKAD